MIANFCFWWLWRLEVNPMLTKDFNHWYQFSSKKLGPWIMCVWEQDWVKLKLGRTQTLNRCQTKTWRGSWVFVQILALIFSSPVFLWQLILSSWEGGYNLQCQDLTSAGEADIRVSQLFVTIFHWKREKAFSSQRGGWSLCLDKKGSPS